MKNKTYKLDFSCLIFFDNSTRYVLGTWLYCYENMGATNEQTQDSSLAEIPGYIY